MEPFLVDFVKSRIHGTITEEKLRIVMGPAMDSLKSLKDDGKKFDLIFIDADKVNYINYYKVKSIMSMHIYEKS